MSEAADKMIRKQFLVPPATAKRLEDLAAQHGTSASEIVRQAINAFDVHDMDAIAAPELMELVSARLKEAIKATRQAQKNVSLTLQLLDGEAE